LRKVSQKEFDHQRAILDFLQPLEYTEYLKGVSLPLEELDEDVDKLYDTIRHLTKRIPKLESAMSKQEVQTLILPLEQKVEKVRGLTTEVRTSFTEFQQRIEENLPELKHGVQPRIEMFRNEIQQMSKRIDDNRGDIRQLQGYLNKILIGVILALISVIAMIIF